MHQVKHGGPEQMTTVYFSILQRSTTRFLFVIHREEFEAKHRHWGTIVLTNAQ